MESNLVLSDFFVSAPNFMVKIEVNDSFICSAVILNSFVILTVANCVYNIAPENISVLTGSDGDQQIGTRKIIKHGSYNNQTFSANIAILVLSKAIRLNSEMEPIRFPKRPSKFKGNLTYFA